MSGPPNCFVCSAKFGLFKRQHECQRCHRIACKSCLSNTIVLPELGNSPQPVCKLCFDAFQKKNQSSGRVSPPANFKREMVKKKEKEKLDASNVPDPVDEQITERLRKLKESYDRKDISVDEIQSRLQKLCASEPSVTMEELEYRLAKLKGSRPPAIRVHSIRKRPSSTEAHCSSDTSERKQVKRLIRQYTEEIAIEAGRTDSGDVDPESFQPGDVPINPGADDLIELARVELRRAEDLKNEGRLQDDEIRRRLSQLTDAPKVPIEDATLGIQSEVHFEEDGMDEETANLIRKLLEEDRMEQDLAQTGVVLPSLPKKNSGMNVGDSDVEKELPWCFMCNDDATIRCLTCEDLFCDTCFRVVHRESGMKGHKTKKFVNPNPDSP